LLIRKLSRVPTITFILLGKVRFYKCH